MTDLILWTGPVWAGNLEPVRWSAPTTVLALPCKGSEGCAALGYDLPEGRRLEALCSRSGLRLADYERVMLAGFSAGHGLSDLLLREQATRERLDAYCSFDSYYTGPSPGIKPGALAFARRSSQPGSGKLMWSSSSGFGDGGTGRNWLSCEESIAPLLAAVGAPLAQLPAPLAPHLRPPKYVLARGGFIHAYFEQSYKHTEHATVLAPEVLSRWISPQLHAQPDASSRWLPLVAGAAVVVAAVALGWWWDRRKR